MPTFFILFFFWQAFFFGFVGSPPYIFFFLSFFLSKSDQIEILSPANIESLDMILTDQDDKKDKIYHDCI